MIDVKVGDDYLRTIGNCPKCGGKFCLFEFDNGRNLGKCEAGCTMRDIMIVVRAKQRPEPKPSLIDIVGDENFLEALAYRRSRGWDIDRKTLNDEMAAFKRVKLGRPIPPSRTHRLMLDLVLKQRQQ